MAVVGKDVSRSISPQIHNFIALQKGYGVIYDKISVPQDRFDLEIGRILKEYDGLNVTVPYKLSVIPYLKKIESEAELFGSVNTVTTEDLNGYNTDGKGFTASLENNCVDIKGKTALLLGAGGAGRSLAGKLLEAGAKVSVYDINRKNLYDLTEKFHLLIPLESLKPEPYFAVINATGVGMHESVGTSPAGGELLKLCEVAIDLIYTPKISRFLEIAKSYGKKIINGEDMLFYQAYYSECIFFGLKPDGSEAKELFRKFKSEKLK